MNPYPYVDDVANGIAYLDENYSEWWLGVDDLNLDIDDPRWHIIAQVTGKLVYETREALDHDADWQQAHGFLPRIANYGTRRLTAEWQWQIRQIREGKR